MSQVKLLKNINTTKLQFKLPQNAKGNTKFFNLQYEGKPVLIQLPKLPVIFGGISEYTADGEDKTNYTVNLGLSDNPVVIEKLQAIENLYKQFLCDNWSSISGKKSNMTLETLENLDIYYMLKYTKNDVDKTSPFLSIKLKTNDDETFNIDSVYTVSEGIDEQFTLTTENHKEYIAYGCEVVSILNIYGWAGSSAKGLKPNFKGLKIWPVDNGNSGFIDDSEPEMSEANDCEANDCEANDCEVETNVIEEEPGIIETPVKKRKTKSKN